MFAYVSSIRSYFAISSNHQNNHIKSTTHKTDISHHTPNHHLNARNTKYQIFQWLPTYSSHPVTNHRKLQRGPETLLQPHKRHSELPKPTITTTTTNPTRYCNLPSSTIMRATDTTLAMCFLKKNNLHNYTIPRRPYVRSDMMPRSAR